MNLDNIMVANPPSSLDEWGYEEAEIDTHNRSWRGTLPRPKGNYSFISHMIEVSVHKKSRVVIVVPHGVLFRSVVEGLIRERPIEDNLLDTVINLPGNLSAINSVPFVILVFNRFSKKLAFLNTSWRRCCGKTVSLFKEVIA